MPLPPKRGSGSQPVVAQPTQTTATRRYRRSAVPEVSPWLAIHPRQWRHAATAEARFQKSARGWPSPLETTATCRYRRSAVPEVSPWLAQPTRDDGDMPLPPKRGSGSQPVVGPSRPRRRRHAATAEARFQKLARGWLAYPVTMVTCAATAEERL